MITDKRFAHSTCNRSSLATKVALFEPAEASHDMDISPEDAFQNSSVAPPAFRDDLSQQMEDDSQSATAAILAPQAPRLVAQTVVVFLKVCLCHIFVLTNTATASAETPTRDNETSRIASIKHEHCIAL